MKNSINKKGVVLKPHHNLAAFCSEDQTRYALTGVHYDAGKSLMEATDGRCLIRVPLNESVVADDFPALSTPLPEPPKSCIIPKEAMEKAFNLVSQKATLPVLECVLLQADGVSASLTSTCLDQEHGIVTKLIESNYPDTEPVMAMASAEKVPAKAKIILDPRRLEPFFEYAQKHGDPKNIGVLLEFLGETEPLRITINLKDNTKATALLMPIRQS